jgi:hypothetical protein
MKILAVLFSSVCMLAAGCASVTNTDSQDINITARDKVGVPVSQTSCEWRNTKGSGNFTPPAILKVRRDYDPLQITCTHPTLGKVNELISSRGSTAMGGNVIAGGLIGAAIDHTSGAGYQYPTSLSIWFPVLSAATAASTPVTAAPTPNLNAAFRKNYSPTPGAKIADVAAVPWVSENCRQRYQQWLQSPIPRGFAIGDAGNCGFSSGTAVTNDLPADPAERALIVCQRANRGMCQLYAMDNDVVFKP